MTTLRCRALSKKQLKPENWSIHREKRWDQKHVASLKKPVSQNIVEYPKKHFCFKIQCKKRHLTKKAMLTKSNVLF